MSTCRCWTPCTCAVTSRLTHSSWICFLCSLQFVKFANIEEDTPSYHRRYDFFVSQFSAMCHSTHEDPETRTRYQHRRCSPTRNPASALLHVVFQSKCFFCAAFNDIFPPFGLFFTVCEVLERHWPLCLQLFLHGVPHGAALGLLLFTFSFRKWFHCCSSNKGAAQVNMFNMAVFGL